MKTYFNSSTDPADVIRSLSVVKSEGGGRLLLNPEGKMLSTLPPDFWVRSLRPILDIQPYIFGLDYGDSGNDISGKSAFVSSWLTADSFWKVPGKPVVVFVDGQSVEYEAWDWVVGELGEEAFIVGDDQLTARFRYRKDLVYIWTNGSAELSRVVSGSKLVIGPQGSLCLALAEGLGKPCIYLNGDSISGMSGVKFSKIREYIASL